MDLHEAPDWFSICQPDSNLNFLGGIQGALRIPFLSFQFLRRPGCVAKLLCFHTFGGFDLHRPRATILLSERGPSKDLFFNFQPLTSFPPLTTDSVPLAFCPSMYSIYRARRHSAVAGCQRKLTAGSGLSVRRLP